MIMVMYPAVSLASKSICPSAGCMMKNIAPIMMPESDPYMMAVLNI
jgi:hypothetical protein